MAEKIEILLRLVIELAGQSFTVAVQSEAVHQPDKVDTPRLPMNAGSDSYTVECPYCGWMDSYPKQSNARRGLSAHARQMHSSEWQRHRLAAK